MTNLDRQLQIRRKSTTLKPVAAILALLAFALVWIPSAASAATPAAPDSIGVDGFAICGTLDPTSSYYVPGDPVYISEIFQVKTDSPDYQQAFKDFLKQKYGWTKTVTCAAAYTSDGATKTFNEKLKQAGSKLVRTGWTLASAGSPAAPAAAAAAPAPAASATASDPAAGNSLWVCRVTGADGKDYNSDIFRGSDGGYATFPTVFGQFVKSKYNVKSFQGNPTCTDYGVLGQQQAQDALKGFASYSTGVMTGWKYGATAPVSAAAASAAPAGGAEYWVCRVTGQSDLHTYDSAIFTTPTAAEDKVKMAAAFAQFVKAKYNVKSFHGGPGCIDNGSGAAGQKKAQDLLKTFSSTDVATGWKYADAAPVAAAPPSATPTPSAMAAPTPSPNQGNGQPNGELGHDGGVIGGSTSGVMTAYYCYAQTIPPGKHRQTSYTTGAFTSAQPQLWITFWFSQYIHQTYSIPANVAIFTINCYTLGNKTPAQQQAVITENITSWKQHDNDVVQVNWVPTQTPTPGISVGQLNPMSGQMTNGGIGSNLATTGAAGVAMCEFTAKNKYYYSGIFDAPNDNDKAKWEVSWANYILKQVDPFPGNSYCRFYQSRAAAQKDLQIHKDQAGAKLVETGWVYTGPA